VNRTVLFRVGTPLLLRPPVVVSLEIIKVPFANKKGDFIHKRQLEVEFSYSYVSGALGLRVTSGRKGRRKIFGAAGGSKSTVNLTLVSSSLCPCPLDLI